MSRRPASSKQWCRFPAPLRGLFFGSRIPSSQRRNPKMMDFKKATPFKHMPIFVVFYVDEILGPVTWPDNYFRKKNDPTKRDSLRVLGAFPAVLAHPLMITIASSTGFSLFLTAWNLRRRHLQQGTRVVFNLRCDVQTFFFATILAQKFKPHQPFFVFWVIKWG